MFDEPVALQVTMETACDNIFEERFTSLCAELDKSGVVRSLSKEFGQLKTDQARVEYVISLPAVDSFLKLPPLTELKSLSRATDLRNAGNKQFTRKNYASATNLYTQSVSASPVPPGGAGVETSNVLALAFANRSAAAFHTSDYKACLADIELAFTYGYPEGKTYKLFDRRAKCYSALQQPVAATESIQEGIRRLDVADLDPKQTATWQDDFNAQLHSCAVMNGNPACDDVKGVSSDGVCRSMPVISVDKMNTTFTSLTDACEVVFSPDRGRYIVAKRDIKPGEVILLERAYASVLLPEYRWSHCHHCISRAVSTIPCVQCSSALYCSETCRSQAWSTYHRAECLCLDMIYVSGVGKFGHLALRTVAVETLEQRLAYKQKLDAGENGGVPDILKGCDENGKYVAGDHNAIYNLVTHSQDRAVHDLFRRSIIAVFLTRCLQRCGYFGENEHNAACVAYIAGLILSYLQLLPCNAHEISELQLDRNNVATSVSVEIGAGIYSTLSLFNHSCDPAVVRHMYGQTCVSRAIKTVHAGEELSDNYGAHFAVQPRVERQDKLKTQYFFTCSCVACCEDWPTYIDAAVVGPTWKCPNCRKAMKTEANAATVVCKECGTERNTNDCISILTSINGVYRKAFDDLLKCDVDRALPPLLRHLEVLDELVCLPWRDYNSCQEAVKQCYSIMSNCHTSK